MVWWCANLRVKSMKALLSSVFLVSGLFLILVSGVLLAQHYNPQRVAFSGDLKVNSTRSQTLAKPVILQIPSVDINLPIYPTSINGGIWPVTDKGVSFLSASPTPGEMGNSIVYGHNFTNLLGNLRKVKVGDKIQVQMSDGSQRSFIVAFVSVVTPDQVHILQPSQDRRLTVYTCTGFLDSKRLVVTAIRV